MADKIVAFLHSITSNNALIVALVSAFPLIELKGAIPIGMKAGLELWQAFALAYVGSTLVSIPLFFLLKPIFNLLKKIKPLKKLIVKVENVFYNKAEKLANDANKKNSTRQTNAQKVLRNCLLAFVAVPFPVTGIWTGTAIAVFLNLKFKDSILAISVGNLIAGSIITLLTLFFEQYVDIIIYVLLAIAIVMLIVLIVKIALSPSDEKTAKNGDVNDN